MKKIGVLFLVLGLCLGLALPSYASLDDGLEVYYAFDAPFDNNKILDSSGNNRPGTVHGDVQQAEGILGYAAMFDGNGDYISGASVEVGTENFTVSFWFKTMDTMGYMLDSRLWDGKGYFLIMFNGSVNWGIQGGGQDQNIQVGGYTDDQWHLAVGVREGSWMGLYLDGDLVGDNSGQNALDVGDPSLCMGKRFSVQDDSQYYGGLIDDFRLYSRALSADEVQDLYNMSQVPIPATIWLMASGLFGLVGVRKRVYKQKT